MRSIQVHTCTHQGVNLARCHHAWTFAAYTRYGRAGNASGAVTAVDVASAMNEQPANLRPRLA